MEIIEQEHRTRMLRRGDEELAHRHEPPLTRRGRLPFEGLLELGSAPGRDRVKQSGVPLGHLAESLGDAQVRAAACRRRSRQPDGQRLAPGGPCRLTEQLRLSRPGTAADLDRRPDARADIADSPEHLVRRCRGALGGRVVSGGAAVRRAGESGVSRLTSATNR